MNDNELDVSDLFLREGAKRPKGSNADEWLVFLVEHKDELPFVAVQIAEAIESLERQVYVSGLWGCPKCKFSLMQGAINACDGSVSTRDEPGEKCPNCNTPLWRVTERQAGNDLVKRCEDFMEDAARLNFLDNVNRGMNERKGTKYGWKFDINHLRAALTDCNVPALTVRDAIDGARNVAASSTPTPDPSPQGGGGRKPIAPA